MIKISVRKSSTQELTHEAVFTTQEQVDEWVEYHTALRVWGKPDRWLFPREFTTETTEQSIESREVETLDGPQMQFHFASEFTITESDVTEEIAFNDMVSQALQSQASGRELLAKVWAINEKKARTGQMSEAGFQAIISDAGLALIERLLNNGSLRTAKSLILSNTNPLFSSSEKEMMIAHLTSAIERIYGE